VEARKSEEQVFDIRDNGIFRRAQKVSSKDAQDLANVQGADNQKSTGLFKDI
jgi:hypothetical protein